MPGYGLTDSEGYELVDETGRVVDDACADTPCCGNVTPPPAGGCCESDPPGTPGRRECGAFQAYPGCINPPDPRSDQDPRLRRTATVTGFHDLRRFLQRSGTTAINITSVGACGPLPLRIDPSVNGFVASFEQETTTEITQTGNACREEYCGGTGCCVLVCVPVLFSRRERLIYRRLMCVNEPQGFLVTTQVHEEDQTLTAPGIVVQQVCCHRLPVNADNIPPLYGNCLESFVVPHPSARTIETQIGSCNVSGSTHTVAFSTSATNRHERTDAGTTITPLETLACGSDFICIATGDTTTTVPAIQQETDLARSLSSTYHWSSNCDESPAENPTVCPGGDPCNPPPGPPPPPTRYIVGEHCPGSVGAPFAVLPESNVLVCGTANINGACYKFDPAVNLRLLAVPPGAVLGTAIISQPTSCCECLGAIPDSGCESIPLVARADWTTGAITRDELGNISGFTTGSPYVAGKCCCSGGDVFRLINGVQRLAEDFHPNGEERRWQQSDILGQVKEGFRRDAATIGYSIRRRLLHRPTPGGPILPDGFDQETAITPTSAGPIGCEWFGLQGGSIVPNITFDRPHAVQGGEVVNTPVRIPIDLIGTDGSNQGWYCVRYDIAVTCQLFLAEAVWERYAPDGRAVTGRISSTMHWSVTSDPQSPCTGGCSQPPAGPGPIVPPPDVIPGLMGGIGGGGCSGCGGDGRLAI